VINQMSGRMPAWSYRLEHVDRMTTERGMYEHASGTVPREEHGYCTDDNARLLLVMCREPGDPIAHRLSSIALRFLLDAQSDDGLFHNRFRNDGYWRWIDEPSNEDWWGRGVWGLGVAAASHPDPWIRDQAMWAFDRSVHQRSPFLHAMAFAALGAADVAIADPSHAAARALLADAVTMLQPPGDPQWPWPQPRLTYGSASLAEAVIAAGIGLEDPQIAHRGLGILRWLIDMQSVDGHLSVVGVGGRGPGQTDVQFDQQPIEVAAIADACWRAWTLTGDLDWAQGIVLAANWFAGDNDSRTRMQDDRSGGSYDGLKADGRNLNQGAESTLALVSTMQRARTLLPWAGAIDRMRMIRMAAQASDGQVRSLTPGAALRSVPAGAA
jgi:hypothetical protein